jgi:hypothetical protein
MEVVMLREGGRTQLVSAQHALFGLASARPRPGSFKFTPLFSDLTYGSLIGGVKREVDNNALLV